MSIIAAVLLMAVGAGDVPAVTQPETTTNAQPAKPETEQASNDPMVCHSYQELGSRLKRRKVCMHKSEWDAQNREEKMMINRTQVQRGTIGN